MICYAETDIGRVRALNEDSIYTSTDREGPLSNLFIVADGMGGHNAGDFASRFVVENVAKFVEEVKAGNSVTVLRRAIEKTNRFLYEEAGKDPDKSGMGSTIVAATISEDTLFVANVGDSRLYLLRDKLTQVTRDHSLVDEMVSRGIIEKGSDSYRSRKNIITRAMGSEPEVDVDFFEVPLEPGDVILMCSDGLINMVDERDIEKVLRSAGTLKEKCHTLIKMANENGGRDNVTVIIVEPQISEVGV